MVVVVVVVVVVSESFLQRIHRFNLKVEMQGLKKTQGGVYYKKHIETGCTERIHVFRMFEWDMGTDLCCSMLNAYLTVRHGNLGQITWNPSKSVVLLFRVSLRFLPQTRSAQWGFAVDVGFPEPCRADGRL